MRLWWPGPASLGARGNVEIKVGDVIAIDTDRYRYRPWFVAEITPRGDSTWAVVLRDPKRRDTRDGEQHALFSCLRHGRIYVLPERYALCSCCGDLMPCRQAVADEAFAAITRRTERFATPGVCPACEEVVSSRQEAFVTDTNLYVPLGPPVTFHLRRKCRRMAIDYDKAVARSEGREPRLSCAGCVTRHLARPDECSNATCPGAHVEHRSADATCRIAHPCPACRPPETTPPTPARIAEMRATITAALAARKEQL